MKRKFNFSWVFSIVVLLAFAYITFLGLVYWRQGDLSIPLLMVFGFIAVVVVCLLVMCMSKASRWKSIGTFGQIFFGFIILVAFLLSSVPFTNFLRVSKDSEVIASKVDTVCNAAIALDDTYFQYVEDRIEDYKDNLRLIATGKAIAPEEYRECLEGATGATDEEKIDALAKSLKMKLLPDTTESIVRERHRWIENARECKILNPMMPANICKLDAIVNGWLENYQSLSAITYKGEEYDPFEYPQFQSSLRKLTEEYAVFKFPSLWAILISLVCFGIMLLPFFMTEGDIAGAGGSDKKKKGKDKDKGQNLFYQTND